MEDKSARQGEIVYKYTACSDFFIVDASTEEGKTLIRDCIRVNFDDHDKLNRELLMFQCMSNQTNEQLILGNLLSVSSNIKGVYRMQGDGPVYIFFGIRVRDSLRHQTLYLDITGETSKSAKCQS